MKVTAKIKLDLRSQNYGSSVYAVQGDGGSRCVEAALLDGGKPWNVPAGVTAAVAYKKPDFTKGLYDKLADDTPAVTVSGSTVTVVLAKQMLTVPGSVQACIVFNNAALDQLTTFPFTVAVAANPVICAEPSDDYIRLQWLEDKLDEYVKKITEGLVPGGSGGAVSSVNGKTGAVVLTAGDVHALPDNTVIPTVPEKVSAFENDAGYLTEHQDISGKVDKVAGKGLSTHDYDDAAKAKVDAIPKDPKYTDTVYDDTEVKQGLNQLKDDLANLAPAGAAVGQLFRVAAISEEGKYNMEPVDMPSGGGENDASFEHIATVTLTEAASSLIISSDKNGNPFVLSDALIDIEEPAYSETGNMVYFVGVNRSTVYNGVASLKYQKPLSTSKTFTRILLRVIGKSVFSSYLSTSSTNPYNSYEQKINTNIFSLGGTLDDIGTVPDIKSIIFKCDSADMLKPGTVFKLYGRRKS